VWNQVGSFFALYKWEREICISSAKIHISLSHLYISLMDLHISPEEIHVSAREICISFSPTTQPSPFHPRTEANIYSALRTLHSALEKAHQMSGN